MSIAADDKISGFRQLTDRIHQEGVKVFEQIRHAGSAALSKITGQPPIAPCAVYHPKQKEELPEEMTVRQIREVTDQFAKAALRAKKSGFDGVEIRSALCVWAAATMKKREVLLMTVLRLAGSLRNAAWICCILPAE